jgi:tetratricopeptide (TPR) repeat protein
LGWLAVLLACGLGWGCGAGAQATGHISAQATGHISAQATGHGAVQPGEHISAQAAAHTDPLNLDPLVRQGYERFYNMDYDGALKYFNQVAQQHAQDPMAWNYILLVKIFRELYDQDLLDTTYYAHNSFLFSKREIDIPKKTREEIDGLTDKVVKMCDARLDANPQDKNALFARGYARGMHAAFITLADHSFTAAARQGLQSRNDSEAVLKIDPQYADAEMAVGIQEFAVASLPRFVRLLVGFMGVGGSKTKGLAMLRIAAAHGVVTSVESRTALSLFLRHDGRYAEALEVERGLATEYPHDYLFQLEVANLLKDSGQGLQAIAAYKQVIADAEKPGYFVEPRLQMAWFGLADTERGYNQLPDAANSFVQAAEQPNCSDWLRRRAQVNAGEVYDMLHERAEAVKMYQRAAAPGGDQSQAEMARKYLKSPYVGR